MGNEIPEPMDAFESWLLHRVAQAVEAGEVSGDLLTELQAEFAVVRERLQGEGHVAAIQHIADIPGVTQEETGDTLTAIDAPPTVTRELPMCRMAEA